ncbi:MAG: SGNH/GDSL hydrolase family protein [Sporolactobacillus sp.]|jgi:lysophospholipase L1-like esterase|nr:SGNH/GDSL hydrolase family protein [Sporolactobacillus sp.]
MLIVIGGLAFYWLAKPGAPDHRPVEITYRIVALGDSLTEGVGDLKDKGYAGQTAVALKQQKHVKKVSMQNFGHRGDTSDDLLTVLQKKQVREAIKRSNTVLITIGGNDIVGVLRNHFMNLSEEDFSTEQQRFLRNLKQILAEIGELNPKAQIYYMGLYNPFEEYMGKANKDFEPILHRWNNGSRELIKKYRRVTYIPTFDLFHRQGDALFYEDHFHPNKEGYRKISGRLLRTMKKVKSP